ncbi:hypothetical protein ACEPAH_3733 [Sanghuangporus vaninii]
MSAASQQTQQQAQAAHTPSASAPSDSSGTEELSWEGDRMFNIYIWDYCVKRGYTNTARELAEEAKLQSNPRPPIDAKQGLLYEWWSVFWLLFSAKSNNSGSEDAMVYIQNHVAQSRMPQVPGAMPRYPNGLRSIPGVPGTMPTVPNSLGAGVPPHSGHPNHLQSAHAMPNGIGPAGPGQQPPGQPQGLPQQQTPGQQPPPQAPLPLGFPAHVQQQHPQPNGIPGHGRPPMQGQPGRPPLPFYPSPTMAHQQPGGASGPYPGPGPMGNAGIPPNMYSQPHMRGMLPPGAPNGVGGSVAGSPRFSQGNVGAGSRAPTPAQSSGSGITQPSPSMAHRSVAATPPNFGGPSGMSVPGGRGPAFDQVTQLTAELSKIDTATINELRQELGLGNKDTTTMSMEEKSRLVTAFKSRNAPGPSNSARTQQGRGSKRNSVSPGDEHAEIPAKDEASPPAQKRQRRSPEQALPPAPGPAGSAPSSGASNPSPAGAMFPPNIMPNGMRQGLPFTPQMNTMGVGQGPPAGMMMPPGMVNQQMPQFQKHPGQPYPNLQPMQKSDIQQAAQQPQFGTDPNQGRPGPPPFGGGQRPSINQGKMLPPNSPATSTNTNGQGKPASNAQIKTEASGKIDSSPRNGPPPPPSGLAGRSPPTPAPGQPGTAAQSPALATQSRPTTSTSNPPGGGTPVQTPVSQLPPPPASAPPAPASAEPMTFDFMSTGFDDFTSMFGRDDNFDLERDFGIGNWFGGADITGMTDLK